MLSRKLSGDLALTLLCVYPLCEYSLLCINSSSEWCVCSDEDEVFSGIQCADQVKEILMTQIRRRLTPQAVKV